MQTQTIIRVAVLGAVLAGGLAGVGSLYNYFFGGANATRVEEHAATLKVHSVGIDENRVKNIDQDKKDNQHDLKLVEHDGRLDVTEATNREQDRKLTEQGEKIDKNRSTLDDQGARVDDLEKANQVLRESLDEQGAAIERLSDDLEQERKERKANSKEFNERLREMERILGAGPPSQ